MHALVNKKVGHVCQWLNAIPNSPEVTVSGASEDTVDTVGPVVDVSGLTVETASVKSGKMQSIIKYFLWLPEK